MKADSRPSRGMRPWLVSVAIHALLIAVIIWVTVPRQSGESRELGFYGDAYESPGGMGSLGVKPPLGRSVSAAEANDYVGQYSIGYERRHVPATVSRINDGGDHWSLLVEQIDLSPYKIIPVAGDTFVHQMIPGRRIVFVRGDSGVTGIELHIRGTIRRGAKIRQPPAR